MRDASDLDGAALPGRQLPHSVEAEMAVLGAILVNPRAHDRVRDFLRPEHFAYGPHRPIFEAVRRLADAGRLADAVTMKAHLANAGSLEEAGGPGYLNRLVDCAVTPSNAAEYGRLVHELHLRREMIAIGDEVMARAYSWANGGADDLRAAARALQGTVERMSTGDPEGFPVYDADDLEAEPIPPREWLLGTLLCRRYLTVLAARGGAGKTTLLLAWALSLATGRSLIGEHVHHRCRVLVVTLEDSLDECRRRLRAVRLHHNVGDVRGWLSVSPLAGRDVALAMADGRDGRLSVTGVADKLLATARRVRADVVMLDPYVKLAVGDENDNRLADVIARVLVRIADESNAAVALSHHFRKGATTAGSIDAARGAGAIIDAARLALTLTVMSDKEAEGFGLSNQERRLLVRLDDGKVNLAPPTAATRWYQLISVPLGNGTPEYPNGDHVQAVECWTPPDLWGGLSIALCNAILDDIDAGLPTGDRYSDAAKADKRAAWPVVLRHAPNLTEEQAKKVIATWRENGVLEARDYRSPVDRRKRKGLHVVPSKRPG